jgi:aminoglycoside 3-N-acetyltransferase I
MKEETQIIKLAKNDLSTFQKLIDLLNEVFDEYHSIASDAHLEELLKKSEFHAFAVIANNKVVAGLTAYELQKYYNDKSELYIYDIAVKTEFQNLGIGKKLIQFVKEYCFENGVQTLFVEAHSEEEQAVKFYESTFGVSEKVDHFNFEIENLN